MSITSNYDQDVKRLFVERLSFALIADDRFGLESLTYLANGCNETVRIRYKNGYTKSVNVTGDSCRAIAEDVLKRV